jgi:hypothetical protein
MGWVSSTWHDSTTNSTLGDLAQVLLLILSNLGSSNRVLFYNFEYLTAQQI